MHMGSPDFRLVDFAHRVRNVRSHSTPVNRLKVSQYVCLLEASLEHHQLTLAVNERSRPPTASRNTGSQRVRSASAMSAPLFKRRTSLTIEQQYMKALCDFQVTTARFHGDYGKRNINQKDDD